MIKQLSAEHSVRRLCQLLDLPSSTYYYQSQRQEDDPELVKTIEQHLALRPYLGYRMLLARLRRDKWVVSERLVRRILRQMKRTRSAGWVITTDSNHSHPRFPNVIQAITAVYPNHIWVGDITYLRYGRQFLYLAVILDAYTRAVRGWHLEELLTCEALTLPALQMALQTGTPTFFHSDQGRQYAAKEHVELLQAGNTTISMSDAGCPTQNSLVERFIRTVKEEHIAYSEYDTVVDLRRQLRHYLEVEYTRDRPHSSLNYMTPLEFEQDYYWRQVSLLST